MATAMEDMDMASIKTDTAEQKQNTNNWWRWYSMNKKISSALLAIGLAASVGLTVYAVERTNVTGTYVSSPSLTATMEAQIEIEGVDTVVEVAVESTVSDETAEGETATPISLEEIKTPTIQITLSSVTKAANEKADAAGVTSEEQTTSSKLSYSDNAKTNAVVDSYENSTSTTQFINSYGITSRLSAEVAVRTAANQSGTTDKEAKNIDNYKAMEVFDISANSAAKVAAGGASVTMTVSMSGVKKGDTLLVAHFQDNGRIQYLQAKATDGKISFSVNLDNLSPFMVLRYVKPTT